MNVEFFILQSFSEELRKQHAYEFGCVSTSLILSMKLKMQGVDTGVLGVRTVAISGFI